MKQKSGEKWRMHSPFSRTPARTFPTVQTRDVVMGLVKFMNGMVINKETVRYIVAGTFNTLFCYFMFTIFLFIGLERAFAMTCATLVAIPVSFFMMGRFVFVCDLTMKRYVSFFLLQGVGYVFNISILLLIAWTGISDYVSGIISLAVTACFTFLVSKYLVFYKPITSKE